MNNETIKYYEGYLIALQKLDTTMIEHMDSLCRPPIDFVLAAPEEKCGK